MYLQRELAIGRLLGRIARCRDWPGVKSIRSDTLQHLLLAGHSAPSVSFRIIDEEKVKSGQSERALNRIAICILCTSHTLLSTERSFWHIQSSTSVPTKNSDIES